MTLKLIISIISLFCTTGPTFGQKEKGGGRPEPNYKQFYPIGEDADISFKTNLVNEETILFEANPIVRFSVSNNIYKNLLNRDRKRGHALYVAFEPQIRMYTDNSLPVKMPSYRVQLGYQQLLRLKNDNFFSYAIESGHYSNGQSGSAFSPLYDDGSPQADSIYRTITTQTNLSTLLNRKDGNFSTNYTDLLLNFRWNKRFDDHNRPSTIHSFMGGLTLYHDRFWGFLPFGGYSDEDINIYGRVRYLLGYEFTKALGASDEANPQRFSISQNFELIQGAHEFVNPLRSVTRVSYYPIRVHRDVGFFINYIYGHDNYNYRFVDKGHQFSIGLTWSSFTPFDIQKTDK